MPMPETAVHKDRNALFYQNNVRSDEALLQLSRLRCAPTRQRVESRSTYAKASADRGLRDWNFAMEPEAVAQAMEQGPDDFFRRRVLAADAAHVPTTVLT